MNPTPHRTLLAAALLAVLPLIPFPAAAQVATQPGKSVEIRTAEPPPHGSLAAAVKAIEGQGEGGRRELRVRVSVVRGAEGTVSTLDLRGDTLPADAIPDAIRKAVPELAGASITVRASTNPLTPDTSALEAEALRQLETAGDGAQVEVKETRDEAGTRREVRVVVRKEKAGAE